MMLELFIAVVVVAARAACWSHPATAAAPISQPLGSLQGLLSGAHMAKDRAVVQPLPKILYMPTISDYDAQQQS
jgi:hypothetical protein